MTAPREWTIDTHLVRFEHPDNLFVKIHGDVSTEAVRQLADICRDVAAKQPFYLIADLAHVGAVSSEARNYASKHIRPDWYLGVAYIGANLITKAAAKGLAIGLYLTGKSSFDIVFVANEDEARVALAKQRTKRGARVA
jgi:hypothetical protein